MINVPHCRVSPAARQPPLHGELLGLRQLSGQLLCHPVQHSQNQFLLITLFPLVFFFKNGIQGLFQDFKGPSIQIQAPSANTDNAAQML